MCWVSYVPVRENIAEEDIPIFKVCRYANNDMAVSYYKNFIYILNKIYNTKCISKQATNSYYFQQVINEGFHSYSSKHCRMIGKCVLTNRYYQLDHFEDRRDAIKVNGIIPKGSKYYLNDGWRICI